MISVVIPSCNEIFLNKTLTEILAKARGEIEVIVSLDGYWQEPIIGDPRIHYVHFGNKRGMRNGINSCVAIAKGEYILKLDAHCMLDEGFDVKLAAEMEDNWVVIPRRKRLDAENWTIQDVGKPDIDYEFLSYPFWKEEEPGMHGTIWTERIVERKDNPKYEIDENLSFQGSCYFIKKSYFHDLELLDEENFGSFANEAQEIGFKTWLSGGKVMTNKKTWYAHWHKGKQYGRGYFISKGTIAVGRQHTMKWITDRWHKQKYPFDWMIDRFMPMPTWPENWKEELKKRGYDVK